MKKPSLTKISDSIAIESSSRRMFLITSTGLLAIPFLESLVPSVALATTANPRRFIFVRTGNQLPSPLVFPTGFSGATVPADLANFIASKSDGAYPYREMNLAQVIAARGQISPFFNTDFNSYASRMSLYRGLDFPGRIDHGASATLGNIAGSHMGTNYQVTPMRTMDEFLANSTNFYTGGKQNYRIPVLRLGEYSLSTDLVDPLRPTLGTGLSGNNASMTLNGNLSLVFDRMFESTASAAAKVPIVDRIVSALGLSKAQRRIGVADSRRLDDYLTSLSELQQSFTATTLTPAIPKPALTLTSYLPSGICNDADIANAI